MPCESIDKIRGEHPKDIFFVVGCPSIDVLQNTPLHSKEELEKNFDVGISVLRLTLMIQHPVTTEAGSLLDQIRETLSGN